MYRWLRAVGWAVSTAAVPLRAQQPAVAFVNVSVVPMDTVRVLSGQTVLVQGGRIAALGPAKAVRIPSERAGSTAAESS